MLTVSHFPAGEAFNLSFTLAGEYRICYTPDRVTGTRETCFMLDVLERRFS